MEQVGGKFIVFEGIDGSGKTTQIHLLADRLREMGYEVVITAEPSEHPEGRLLRRALAGEFPSTAAELAALFAADRIAHNCHKESGIRRALSEGKIVLCDRYYYSSMAYQGSLCGMDYVAALNLNCPGILCPDLCVFLDLTPDESMERILKNRTNLEIFETREQLERVRDSFFSAFAYLRETDRGEHIVPLSAAGDPATVGDRVFAAVKDILP